MSTLLASGTLSRSCAQVLTLAFGALFCARAQAQQSEGFFSVDWQGQTTGQLDQTTGRAVTDGDLLVQQFGPFPGGPGPVVLPVPQVVRPADFLNAYTACAGHAPGISCGLELDAVSFGNDALLLLDPLYQFQLYFSVDEFAQGIPLGGPFATVQSEAAMQEAAADIFVSRLQGIGPFLPGQIQPNNVQVADGNGESASASGVTPGLGLIEPSPPSSQVPDQGSNLDAFELSGTTNPAMQRIFFSLQGSVQDPLEPTAVFFDSAAAQGFRGGDILEFDPGTGQISLYAPADVLGLDRFGFGLDDVDALVVVENGIPGYQAPTALYDWQFGVSDLILFSVRRGSDIIGTPDSLQGLPIRPGDVLIPPIGGGFLGSPPPGTFVPSGTLGLGPMDELDALDAGDGNDEPLYDCNDNGVEDSTDIADGTSSDDDSNGIPDECEDPGFAFCDCNDAPEAPCGNTAGFEEGCSNATAQGGKLVGTGTSSVATDSLVLTSSQLPTNNFGLVFTGNGSVPHTTVGNGSRCVGGTAIWRLHIGATGPGGGFTYGPGILADANTFPNFLVIMSGETWNFQTWYRDHGGPCGSDSNMTNAWAVTFTP